MKEKERTAPDIKTARQFGFKTYFGKRCSRSPSHGRKRYTNSSNCVACDKAKTSPKEQAARKAERDSRPKPISEPYTEEQEARLESGSAYKFYGNPCKKGHDGLRYVKGGACVDCMAENFSKHRIPAGLTKGERAKWRRAKRLGREDELQELRDLAASRATPQTEEAQPVGEDAARLLWWIVAAA